jgi:hypothetical protein
MFEDWLREDGLVADGEVVSREFLASAARVMLVLVQEMEAEKISRQFRDLLAEC